MILMIAQIISCGSFAIKSHLVTGLRPLGGSQEIIKVAPRGGFMLPAPKD
jgi:hypothetical protein